MPEGEPPNEVQAKAAELAYKEASATFERTLKAVEELRPRMLSLFSAVAVASALVSTFTLSRDNTTKLDPLGYVGITFILLGVGGVAIGVFGTWRPRRLVWGFDGQDLVAAFVDRNPQLTEGDVHRELALYVTRYAARALETWGHCMWWVQWSLVWFLVATVGFVLLLTDGL